MFNFLKRLGIEFVMFPVKLVAGMCLVMVMVIGETWCNIIDE